MHVALPKSRTGKGTGGKLPPGEQRLGFLAAGRDEQFGYVGGYLLTTARGRPLEFHYTTPVKPSATHRILYGVELEPYIYGELIAANLVRQSTIEPAFLITDQPLVLDLRASSSCPILCIRGNPTGATVATVATDAANPAKLDHECESARPETASAPVPESHRNFPQDIAELTHWLDEANPGVDLREPLARLWEALREVLRAETQQAA